jgi:hypothetical protein
MYMPVIKVKLCETEPSVRAQDRRRKETVVSFRSPKQSRKFGQSVHPEVIEPIRSGKVGT